MSKLNSMLCKGDDPILKERCAAVEPGERLEGLMRTMEAVCKKTKIGVGLAAPQVGVSKRVILTVLADSEGSVRARFFVNPVIAEKSTETAVDVEGCLSYPGRYKTIERHDWIELSFHTPDGKKKYERFAGFAARVIQHEVDHLNGICRVGDGSDADVHPDTGRHVNAGPGSPNINIEARQKPRLSDLVRAAALAGLASMAGAR